MQVFLGLWASCFFLFCFFPWLFSPTCFFTWLFLTFWKFWNFSSFKPILCIPTMVYFFPDVFLSMYYFSPFTHCLIILFCRSRRLVQLKLLKSGSCLLDGCVLIAVLCFCALFICLRINCFANLCAWELWHWKFLEPAKCLPFHIWFACIRGIQI